MMTKVEEFLWDWSEKKVEELRKELEEKSRKEKATEKAMLLFAKDKQEDGIPRENIVKKLIKYYHLSEDNADRICERTKKMVF